MIAGMDVSSAPDHVPDPFTLPDAAFLRQAPAA
jgi:hypothetical protein